MWGFAHAGQIGEAIRFLLRKPNGSSLAKCWLEGMVRPLVWGLCGKLFRVPSVDASDSLKVTAQTHSIVKRTDGTGTKNMSELLAKSKENFLLCPMQ